MSPTADIEQLYAVILAAGCSRRLGQPKQLLAWQGRSLLEWSIIKAQSVCPDRCLVVLGSHADVIRQSLTPTSVQFVENPAWSEGIAASIRAAIRALPSSAQGVLLTLCDQPRIDSSDLAALLAAWQRHPQQIIASEYRGQLGVPALFPRQFFAELLALNGDQGAKRLLQQFEGRVIKISLPNAVYDIDTAEDYRQLVSEID